MKIAKGWLLTSALCVACGILGAANERYPAPAATQAVTAAGPGAAQGEPKVVGRLGKLVTVKVAADDPMIALVAKDLGVRPAEVGEKYDVTTRKLGDWDLVMLTHTGMAPAKLQKKYLYKPYNFGSADGGWLLSALNEIYKDASLWPNFSDDCALDLVTIWDLFEPQNVSVTLIRKISDIPGVVVKTLDPDLAAAVSPPMKFRDAAGRGCYVAYYFSSRGGRILRLRMVFDREHRDKPERYWISVLSEGVGEFYQPH